jgi:hypothetical protein
MLAGSMRIAFVQPPTIAKPAPRLAKSMHRSLRAQIPSLQYSAFLAYDSFIKARQHRIARCICDSARVLLHMAHAKTQGAVTSAIEK